MRTSIYTMTLDVARSCSIDLSLGLLSVAREPLGNLSAS